MKLNIVFDFRDFYDEFQNLDEYFKEFVVEEAKKEISKSKEFKELVRLEKEKMLNKLKEV